MTLILYRSTLKHITPSSFPSSKNIAVRMVHCGFENSFLVDSVHRAMYAGHETSYAELEERIRTGDNYLGALFLAGLESLWRKKEDELQKLNANMVNLRLPLSLSLPPLP